MLLEPRSFKQVMTLERDGRSLAFNYVAITARGVEFSDGGTYVCVPHPKHDPSDAPNIKGINACASYPDDGMFPFLISVADAKKLAKLAFPKSAKVLPICRMVQAEIVGDELRCAVTDLKTSRYLTIARASKQQWPDIRNAFFANVKRRGVTEISLRLSSLKELVTIMASSGESGYGEKDQVTIRLKDQNHGLSAVTSDGVMAVFMPYNCDDAGHLPDPMETLL